MSGGDAVQAILTEQTGKESIAHFPGHSFNAGMAGGRLRRDITAVPVKLKLESRGQVSDESLIGFRVRPSQLVVEVDHRQHGPEFFTQFEQEPQEADGIGASRDGDAQAVAGFQKLVAANVGENSMRQILH
jgi:hypothetical protein